MTDPAAMNPPNRETCDIESVYNTEIQNTEAKENAFNVSSIGEAFESG